MTIWGRNTAWAGAESRPYRKKPRGRLTAAAGSASEARCAARVRGTLFNLTEAEQQGECEVKVLGFTEPYDADVEGARRAVPIVQPSMEFAVEPSGAKRLSFPIRSLERHEWTVRVSVAVKPRSAASVRRNFLLVPLVMDGSWEISGTEEEIAADGKRTLTLPPSTTGYQHRLVYFFLEPRRRYRFRVLARRSGFRAAVSGTRLMVQAEKENAVYKHYSLDRNRPDEWQEISDVFETPPDLTRAGIYLYNVKSPDTAWFDALQIEDIGAARSRD